MAGTLADLLSIATDLTCEDVDKNGKPVLDEKGEPVAKTYAMRPPNQLEQGKFQRWLEQRAYEALDRRTYVNDEARAKAENALTRDISAGVYEWGGDVASLAVLSTSGAAKLLELICGVPPVEAIRVINTHATRVRNILTAASTDDPKALAEALKAVGLPSNFLSSDSATPRSTKRKRKSRR